MYHTSTIYKEYYKHIIMTQESFNADHIMVEGWYRATSGAGGDMPTSPPGIGKCQAVAPIWLQGLYI